MVAGAARRRQTSSLAAAQRSASATSRTFPQEKLVIALSPCPGGILHTRSCAVLKKKRRLASSTASLERSTPMDSKAGGLMDGSASDVRDARLCACRTQTVLKKAAPVYDGKTRSAFRGGKRALRAPIIGYGAGTMHGRENARVGPNAGRERRAEGERIHLLHGLHSLGIVGENVASAAPPRLSRYLNKLRGKVAPLAKSKTKLTIPKPVRKGRVLPRRSI